MIKSEQSVEGDKSAKTQPIVVSVDLRGHMQRWLY